MYGYYGLGYGCGLAYGGYTSYLGGYGSRYCWQMCKFIKIDGKIDCYQSNLNIF